MKYELKDTLNATATFERAKGSKLYFIKRGKNALSLVVFADNRTPLDVTFHSAVLLEKACTFKTNFNTINIAGTYLQTLAQQLSEKLGYTLDFEVL